MNADTTAPSQQFLASIQPIVLVGGKSTRFGRDKLREPFTDTGQWLVQRPIAALREVFGPRVQLVGQCHPSLLPLADGMIPDQFPGAGPLGGILSALQLSTGPVFVLAGDMPAFDADSIQAIVAAAWRNASAIAVWACSDREHPCAGLYTKAATPLLASALYERRLTLRDTIPARSLRLVPIDGAKVVNVNRPDELSLNSALALPTMSAPNRTTTLARTDTLRKRRHAPARSSQLRSPSPPTPDAPSPAPAPAPPGSLPASEPVQPRPQWVASPPPPQAPPSRRSP